MAEEIACSDCALRTSGDCLEKFVLTAHGLLQRKVTLADASASLQKALPDDCPLDPPTVEDRLKDKASRMLTIGRRALASQASQ